LIYKQIKFDTQHYWQAVRMREIELRLPLGMRYSSENLTSEENELIFIALDCDQVVASCQFIVENKNAKMRQVATKKSYQGQGIGRELFLYAENYFKQNQIEEIYCHARLTAAPFYLRLGFEVYSEMFLEVGLGHVKMRRRVAD
jgi:predicted GNAT family N-acyltransferase